MSRPMMLNDAPARPIVGSIPMSSPAMVVGFGPTNVVLPRPSVSNRPSASGPVAIPVQVSVPVQVPVSQAGSVYVGAPPIRHQLQLLFAVPVPVQVINQPVVTIVRRPF